MLCEWDNVDGGGAWIGLIWEWAYVDGEGAWICYRSKTMLMSKISVYDYHAAKIEEKKIQDFYIMQSIWFNIIN